MKQMVKNFLESTAKFKPRFSLVIKQQPVKQVVNQDDDAAQQFNITEGVAEKAKAAQMEFWAVVGPFVIWLITGYAEGYFFSGFRGLSFSDPPSVIGYATGFTIAALTLNAIIKSAQHFHNKNYRACVAMITIALVMALASVVAQYMTLEQQVITGRLEVSDVAIERIPLFSVMIGVAGLRGHDWLFLFRSGLLLLGEFIAIYAIPVRREDIEETLRRKREHDRMMREFQHDKQLEAIEALVWQQAQQAVSQNYQRQVEQPLVAKRIEAPVAKQEEVFKPVMLKPVILEDNQESNNHHNP